MKSTIYIAHELYPTGIYQKNIKFGFHTHLITRQHYTNVILSNILKIKNALKSKAFFTETWAFLNPQFAYDPESRIHFLCPHTPKHVLKNKYLGDEVHSLTTPCVIHISFCINNYWTGCILVLFGDLSCITL